LQVIAHLAHTVVSQVSMWGTTYDPSSQQGAYQGRLERSTTPFPYSAISSFPLFLRIAATIIFIAVTFALVIWPVIKLIKLGMDTTLGCAESIKAFLFPTSLQVMAIKKQYRTIASLTTNVDKQPMVMLDTADIATQLNAIRTRLGALKNAGGTHR
jgi:hypothetical protein